MANKLYGRKWRLTVQVDNTTALDISDSDFDDDGPGQGALRITFDIEMVRGAAWNYGDIMIYNLDGNTEQRLIQEGSHVELYAGYQNGNYGRIFSGMVFQPLRDRENVTDYKLTLHCVDDNFVLSSDNFVKFTANAGQDQRTIIDMISKNADKPIPIGSISKAIGDKKLPRGKVVFGDPKKYFRQIAADNDGQFFMSDGQVVFDSAAYDLPEGEAIVVTPETGLIGTPQQIDFGCSYESLLDPRLKINPLMLVKLDMTMIRQMKAIIGDRPPTILDQDRIFTVRAVRHTGDTRGDEWTSHVTGINGMKGMSPEMFIGGAKSGY